MSTFAITTFGCRLNQAESDALRQALVHGGMQPVTAAQRPDVHILNTCTITDAADREAKQKIGRLHREAPEARIVVTGCYATAAGETLRALPGVCLVVGNTDKQTLAERVAALPPAALAQPCVADAAPPRSRVYLKVQDGCDFRCAFCVVPQVRGKSRSVTPDALVAQLQTRVASGAREVVLTGVHLGTYGRDLTPRTSLTMLVQRLLPHLGGCRLRLSSIDPHEVGDALIELMVLHSQQLCRHLHLPMQSADDEVLRRMRRAHTVRDMADLVPKLKAALPDICIGSDIITGFPGESGAHAARTERTLEQLDLAYLHVFPYSQRNGTVAATLPGQVAHEIKKARAAQLRRLSARGRARHIARHLGQTHTTVVHRTADPHSGHNVAVTGNYIKVKFAGSPQWRGHAARLRLIHATGEMAWGEVYKD